MWLLRNGRQKKTQPQYINKICLSELNIPCVTLHDWRVSGTTLIFDTFYIRFSNITFLRKEMKTSSFKIATRRTNTLLKQLHISAFSVAVHAWICTFSISYDETHYNNMQGCSSSSSLISSPLHGALLMAARAANYPHNSTLWPTYSTGKPPAELHTNTQLTRDAPTSDLDLCRNVVVDVWFLPKAIFFSSFLCDSWLFEFSHQLHVFILSSVVSE